MCIRNPCKDQGLSKLFCCFVFFSFFFSNKMVWHCPVTRPVCQHSVCGCSWVSMCECALCIQTPSVWWPDTVWESACRRRIRTQHKGPIMSTHSEKKKELGGEGGGFKQRDNKGLSISEGGQDGFLTSHLTLLCPTSTTTCRYVSTGIDVEKIPVEKNQGTLLA